MSKQTAAGGQGVGPSRRTWDVQEYTSKAREKDREDKERAQENEERLRKGKKPIARRREELPKPTEALQARETPLNLDKDVGKTLMVENAGGRKGPGYYCDLCKRTCKDSIGYLDHVNGRSHLRRLGQTTQVARSTVEQVRARIEYLRSKLAEKDTAQEYDFQARVQKIAESEREAKEERKRKKKEAKEKERSQTNGAGNGAGGMEQDEMMKMMGFGGFGSTGGKK